MKTLCLASWQHWSGGPILVECGSKAREGTSYCSRHRDWDRTSPRFSMEEIEDAAESAGLKMTPRAWNSFAAYLEGKKP